MKNANTALSTTLLALMPVLTMTTTGCGGGGGGGSTAATAVSVTGISPVEGSSTGGTRVTITSDPLGDGPYRVFFGDRIATNVQRTGANQLQCTAPARGSQFEVDIVVHSSLGEGRLMQAYNYGAWPSVDSIEPTSGPSGGGFQATIRGRNFGTSLEYVSFGGVHSGQVSVIDDTTAQVRIPAGVPNESVLIEVHSSDGTGFLSDGFRYHVEPEITSVEPNTVFEGSMLTIQGVGFLDDSPGFTTASIDGLAVTDIEILADDRMRLRVPEGVTRGFPLRVQVRNDNGSAERLDAVTAFGYPPRVLDQDMRIDGGGSSITSSTIATVGSHVYAAWRDSRSGQAEVYYRRSTDFGASWETPIQISASLGGVAAGSIRMVVAGSPVVAARSRVVIAWSEFVAPGSSRQDAYVMRSTPGGSTMFGSPDRLDQSSTSDSTDIQLAAFGDYVYAVWEENFDIEFSVSFTGGALWAPRTVLANDFSPLESPTVAAWGDSVVVAWQDLSSGDARIYARTGTTMLTGGGQTNFGSVVTIADGTRESNDPSLVTSEGYFNLLWEENRSGRYDILSSRIPIGGTQWSAPVVVAENTGEIDFRRGKAVAASGGHVYVAWESDFELNFRRSTDNGASWTDPIQTLQSPLGATRPKMSASGDTVVVGYSGAIQSRDPRANVSRDGGATWLPDTIKLNTGPETHTSLGSVAVEGARIYATWTDFRSDSTFHLYFTRTLPQ